jgi:hypothetical protein
LNKKRGVFLEVICSIAFGGLSVLIIQNAWANELFAKPLEFICFPVLLLYGVFFGGNDAYLHVYLITCVIYMLALGYLVGYFVHKLLGRKKHTPTDLNSLFS